MTRRSEGRGFAIGSNKAKKEIRTRVNEVVEQYRHGVRSFGETIEAVAMATGSAPLLDVAEDIKDGKIFSMGGL